MELKTSELVGFEPLCYLHGHYLKYGDTGFAGIAIGRKYVHTLARAHARTRNHLLTPKVRSASLVEEGNEEQQGPLTLWLLHPSMNSAANMRDPTAPVVQHAQHTDQYRAYRSVRAITRVPLR